MLRQARVLVFCLVSSLSGLAQSDEVRLSAHVYTPPQMRFSVQSELVQVEVVVRDRQGNVVSGLQQRDFEIFDQGQRREIAAFSEETHEPQLTDAPAPIAAALARLTLLFFDDRHGEPAHLASMQDAAKRFIRAGMGPGAVAAVYSASEGLKLNFTADTDVLIAAIDKLSFQPRISEKVPPTPYEAYLIANGFDPNSTTQWVSSGTVTSIAKAVWQQVRMDSLNSLEAVDDVLAILTRRRGTRVLLMASTGFLTGTLEEKVDSTIRRAIRAGIIINALDAKALWAGRTQVADNTSALGSRGRYQDRYSNMLAHDANDYCRAPGR
jgi:VWFA-related protein